jgi:hypothetical protein
VAGRQRWCAIMAMKAVVSEGDRTGSDEGGGMLRPLLERKGKGNERLQCTREPTVVVSWLSGRRRKKKGWCPRVSEGEGWVGLSRPRGQGPRRVGGRADRPKAKAQVAGLKT